MKNRKLRILSALLAAALTLGLLPTAAPLAASAAAYETTVYSFDFETDPFENGWSKDDIDRDGHNWTWAGDAGTANLPSHSGTGIVWSASYDNADGALTPQNRLVSPYFDVPADGVTTISIMARGNHSRDFAEHFFLSCQIDGGDPVPSWLHADCFVTTNEWQEYTVTISADDFYNSGLLGKRISVIINHWDTTDQFRLLVDDFVVTNSSGALKGDFDKDGEITVADALSALRIAAKLAEATPEAIRIGDIDGNGAVEVNDALSILRVAAKLADVSSLQ